MQATVAYIGGANVADAGSRERKFLAVLLVVIYVLYAAIGRDVFFNTLNMHAAPGAPHLNGFESDPIGYYLPEARVLACAVAALVVINNAGLAWAVSKIPLMFAPFCLFSVASALWAYDPHDTMRDSVVLLFLWVSLPMVIHRIGAVEMVRASLYLIAIVIVLSFFVAILFPTIGRHGFEDSSAAHVGRWRGIFAHKNGLAPWAAYGSVFLFTHGWLCGGARLFLKAVGCMAIVCLIEAGSATGVVMAIAMWCAWGGFILLRRYQLAFVATIVVGALLVGAFMLHFFGDFVLDLLGREPTLTGRTNIWTLAVDHFWQQPYFGVGYQQLGGPQFLNEIFVEFGQAIPGPESAYLELLLDVGVVGSVLFVLPMVLCIRNGFEWLKHVLLEDRASIEFMLMTLFAVLIGGYAETGMLLSTGFDGVLSFGAFFALLTVPKSPEGVCEFRRNPATDSDLMSAAIPI
jgi:O-antigen ligase